MRFAVGHIMKPVATLKVFDVPKDFNPDEFLEGSCGAGEGTEVFEGAEGI
jgi:hypothetical protein